MQSLGIFHVDENIDIENCLPNKQVKEVMNEINEIGSGVRIPLLNNIEALMKIEPPKTKKLLRSFLAGCNFYRSYIKSFSELALPLTELTKNKCSNTVTFNEQQLLAFNNLKQAIGNFTC